MSVFSRVSLFAIGPLISTACKAVGLSAASEGVSAVARLLSDRVSDQSRRVVAALSDASVRAWRTLELALAGESFTTALDRAEDKAFREQVRLFLLNAQFDGRAAADGDFVPRCLAELHAAQGAGLLAGDADPSAVAARPGDLTRFADPTALVAVQWTLANELAGELREQGYPTLASLLSLRPVGDPNAVPLLAVAVHYHFRRAVEDDPRLFQGLAFAQLERIGNMQEDGTAQLAKLMSRSVERLETRLGELKDSALMTRSEVRELRALVASGRPEPAVLNAEPDSGLTPPTHRDVLTGHNGAVACIAVSPDGTHAVTGGADHSLRVWDLVNRRQVRHLCGHRDRVGCVAFSATGRRILSSGPDHTVRLWDFDAGLELKCLDRQTNHSAALAPDGETALCGALYDGKLRLFDVSTGKESKRLTGHADWVVSVAFAADGKVALSAGGDKTIRFWNVASGRLLRTFSMKNVAVSGVAFSPDGWRVLSAGADGIVHGWDTFTGQELFRLVGHTGAVSCVAVSPDCEHAASAGHDGTVRLWDLRLKKAHQQFDGHAGKVLCVAFTPDGAELVSGGEDGTVRVWQLS